MATTIQRSSGNVFTDLGFEPEEALNLKLRSDLIIEISKLIEERDLTQTAAAKLLKVTQPRISDLVRGTPGRKSLSLSRAVDKSRNGHEVSGPARRVVIA